MISFKEYLTELKKFKIRPKLSKYRHVSHTGKITPLEPAYGAGRFASAVDSVSERMKQYSGYKPSMYEFPSSVGKYSTNFIDTSKPNRHAKFYERLASDVGADQYTKRASPELEKTGPYHGMREYTSSITTQIINTGVKSLFAKGKRKKQLKSEIIQRQSGRSPTDVLSGNKLHRTIENTLRGKRYVAPHDMTLYRIQPEHPHEEIEKGHTHVGQRIDKNRRSSTYSTTRFHSFTTNPEMLTKFGAWSNKDKQHLIRLHVPKGTELYIPHNASIYHENEIVLPPTTKIDIHHKPKSFELTPSDQYPHKVGTAGSMWTAGLKEVPSRMSILKTVRKLAKGRKK
jgi:hypothetical protein